MDRDIVAMIVAAIALVAVILGGYFFVDSEYFDEPIAMDFSAQRRTPNQVTNTPAPRL